MMDDTLAMEDDEEVEEEADAEVDKVLFDLTNGKLGQAGTVQSELPVRLSTDIVSLRVPNLMYSRSKTNSRMKRRKELWSNTDSSSVVFSVELSSSLPFTLIILQDRVYNTFDYILPVIIRFIFGTLCK